MRSSVLVFRKEMAALSLAVILSVVAFVPVPAFAAGTDGKLALLGLPSIPSIIHSLTGGSSSSSGGSSSSSGSGSSSSGSGSSSGLLGGISDTLFGTSTGLNKTVDTLIQTVKPVLETSSLLDGDSTLLASSSLLTIAPFVLNEPGTSEKGIQITLGKKSTEPLVAVHVFPVLKDWSDFNKVGTWVYSSVPVDAGRVKLLLSATTGYVPAYLVRSFDLPALKANEWTYISFDLLTNSTQPLPVRSYVLSLAAGEAVSLKLLPLELGPGPVHHLKLVHVPGKATRFIRVLAEDAAGNILDHGANIYSGLKKLVFIRGGVLGVDASPLASVKVNFSHGASDLIDVSAFSGGVDADLGVLEGKVASSLGDVSYNLLSLGGGGDSDTKADPLHSLIMVAPDPAIVFKPVLITIKAYVSLGIPHTQGGDIVEVHVGGANTATLTAHDNGDGTYEAGYTPTKAGTDTISATIGGITVGGDMDGKQSDGNYLLLVGDGSSTSTTPSGSSGGSGGGRSSRSSFGGGADTSGGSCAPYLTKYIKRGENNDAAEVLKLQKFLRDNQGMTQVPLSGVYDDTTFEAVKTFQAANVKTVLSPWQTSVPSGYVYIFTLRAINALQCGKAVDTIDTTITASTCQVFNETLHSGDSGASVINLQKFLVARGYLDSPSAWGFYGPMTTAAVMKFQTAYWKDILTPVNLSAPSGMWLSMSIKKANELSCH